MLAGDRDVLIWSRALLVGNNLSRSAINFYIVTGTGIQNLNYIMFCGATGSFSNHVRALFEWHSKSWCCIIVLAIASKVIM